MPYLNTVSQDEIDAICMGFVATVQMKEGNEESLESKKKVHPFQYNISFIGADDDDSMITEFADTYKGPAKLLENGISLVELTSTMNFDKRVYEAMGQDDKILIMKFSSNHHGNLILKYKIGYLSASYDYIYAVVYRKSRKS
jgi:hypothetical protein